MFSFFKKAPEETYKSNVKDFWIWFEQNAPRLKETIDRGECSSLARETSEAINKMIPHIGWCYGPGEDDGSHALTLSPEGDRNHQFLAEYWIKQAPKIKHWNFYSAKEGGDLAASHTINVGERDYSPEEIWVTPVINEQQEVIDITIWHPHFDELEDNGPLRITFIFLDELLGEYGVENWIGVIETKKDKFSESIPLMELAEYIESVKKTHKWKKLPPTETFHLYEPKAQDKSFPRSDTFVGTTSHMPLIQEYFGTGGKAEDLLDDAHAAFVFIRFDKSILPEGSEVDVRSQIEDAINADLSKEQSGYSMGGAMGTDYAYLDFILFDGERSIELILQAMKDARLPGGTTLHYWNTSKKIHKL